MSTHSFLKTGPDGQNFQRLRLPVFAAPMFLVSGPDMVVAASRAGIVGTFPAPNCRTSEDLDTWLQEIGQKLSAEANGGVPLWWAVNLVVHKTNPRLQADLELVIEHRVPLVFASVGSAKPVIEPIHAYGGVVFTDVVTLKHARQAAAAGVDGLILLTSGAGGHEGTANPFAFVREVRRFFDGPIVLAGCVGDGESILAAQALGADYVAVGTALIAATESLASDGYRNMLIDCSMDDIMRSAALSGMSANFLRPSFAAAGIDPNALERHVDIDISQTVDHELQKKRWKDIWAAGQAVGAVDCVATTAQIVDRLESEYRYALQRIAGVTAGWQQMNPARPALSRAA